VFALNVLLAYTHGVRWLHLRARVPIIPAIALSAAGYCVAGALLKGVLPESDWAFWAACALTLLVAAATHAVFPRQEEPGHRSPLSPWVKLPVVVGVVSLLILIKNLLQGFTTMFPMVGVVAAYEGRYSLGTVCRALPDFMLAMVPMLAVVRLVQPRWGLGAALAAGWLVFIPALLVVARDFWTSTDAGQV
jgi:hypothetical protein